MPQHKEISRFSGSGKTFFLNEGEASNGTKYLAINALYGRGNQERLVLFPPHLLEFSKHLDGAIEHLTGFTRPCKCGNIIHSTQQETHNGEGQDGELGQ